MLLSSDGTYTRPAGLGDLQPSYGQTHFYPNTTLALSDAFASYGAVYRSQVWVATLVNKIAFGTARLPLKVYSRAVDESREEARDSDYAKLLRNPNPRHDAFYFWLWTTSTFEIYGEAIWVKIRPRPGAAPSQLWPLHPANVSTYRNDDGDLVYRYMYGAESGQFLEWTSDDVVHFRSYNPDDQVRGMSRLEPLRQTILNEDATRRATAAMFSNGGRPSFVLTSPKSLSDQAFSRLDRSVKGLHQGVDNWGKIAILEEGLTPSVLPIDAQAMQFIEARKVSREEACGMYDVPPPVVQILDRATFSNITEQMRSLYRDTMAPRLSLFESAIDAQLRPDFDPAGNLYAEFLLDEVLRGAFEARQDALSKADYMTLAEKRRLENLPFIDGTDRIFMNAAEVPMSPPPVAEDVPPAPPFSSVGLPALVAAGVISRDDARVLLGIPGPAPDLPDVVDETGAPVADDGAEKCAGCGVEGKTSRRGLCRSCEGKVGAAMQRLSDVSRKAN